MGVPEQPRTGAIVGFEHECNYKPALLTVVEYWCFAFVVTCLLYSIVFGLSRKAVAEPFRSRSRFCGGWSTRRSCRWPTKA